MSHIILTIALLLSVIPSFGMAVEAIECAPNIYSASSDGAETPAPDSPQRLTTARNMFGWIANSTTMISSTSNAIGGYPVSLTKPIPPVESILGVNEWMLVSDLMDLKILEVPIIFRVSHGPI